MINKKIKKISLFLFSLLIFGIAIAFVFHRSQEVKAEKQTLNQNAYLYLKKQNKKLNDEAEKPFVKINGKIFTNKNFERFKESRNVVELNNGKMQLNDEQIKQEFIRNALLVEEAEKQNIVVTKSEAEEYAKQVRKTLEESSDENAKQFLQDYITALGISEDEYWSQYAVSEYENALKIGKLKEKFFNDLMAKNQEASIDDLNDAWEKYQDGLVQKAKVEFVKQ